MSRPLGLPMFALSAVLVAFAGCAERAPQTQAASVPAATLTPGEGTAPAPSTGSDCVAIEAATEPDGLRQEGRWLRDHYPGWKKVSQSFAMAADGSKRAFDYVKIEAPSGERRTVCFDVTSFLDKF